MDLCLLPDLHAIRDRTLPRRFSSRYFVRAPSTIQPADLDICIYQQNLVPPHFEVALSKREVTVGGDERDGYEVWPIHHGARNVFHSLMLFIYCSKKTHGGFLGHVFLGSMGIDLLSVLRVR